MIQVTDRAAEALGRLLSDQGAQAVVRILVRERGCNCSRYRMALEPGARPGDRVLEVGGVRVVADPRAAELLTGAVLDYVPEGFVIRPPEEAAGCGCNGH